MVSIIRPGNLAHVIHTNGAPLMTALDVAYFPKKTSGYKQSYLPKKWQESIMLA